MHIGGSTIFQPELELQKIDCIPEDSQEISNSNSTFPAIQGTESEEIYKDESDNSDDQDDDDSFLDDNDSDISLNRSASKQVSQSFETLTTT